MKCSVEGCEGEVVYNTGRNDEYHFCRNHREAWKYYHEGFRRGKGFYCDGLIRMKKVWEPAMREFLEHCSGEIVALKQLGATKDTSLAELYRRAGSM